MESKYKLTYYNLRGIAEPIRLIFQYVSVPFEDERLDFTHWPSMKENYPWGVLPILEVDGRTLSQSFAIGRYLGKVFNMHGTCDYETAKCDEYCDALKDFLKELRKVLMEPDETKKAQYREVILSETVPKYLGKFEQDLEDCGKSFLVGSSYTWIDFFVVHYLSLVAEQIDPSVMDKYPKLEAYANAIHHLPAINKWLLERPVTQL